MLNLDQRYSPIQIWLDKNGIPGKTCMKSKEFCLTNIESMAQMAHLWSDQKFKMKNIPYTCHLFTIHAFGITRFYKKINVEKTSIVWKMFQYCLFLVFLHWFNFTNWIQPDLYLVHWRRGFSLSYGYKYFVINHMGKVYVTIYHMVISYAQFISI